MLGVEIWLGRVGTSREKFRRIHLRYSRSGLVCLFAIVHSNSVRKFCALFSPAYCCHPLSKLLCPAPEPSRLVTKSREEWKRLRYCSHISYLTAGEVKNLENQSSKLSALARVYCQAEFCGAASFHKELCFEPQRGEARSCQLWHKAALSCYRTCLPCQPRLPACPPWKDRLGRQCKWSGSQSGALTFVRGTRSCLRRIKFTNEWGRRIVALWFVFGFGQS